MGIRVSARMAPESVTSGVVCVCGRGSSREHVTSPAALPAEAGAWKRRVGLAETWGRCRARSRRWWRRWSG